MGQYFKISEIKTTNDLLTSHELLDQDTEIVDHVILDAPISLPSHSIVNFFLVLSS